MKEVCREIVEGEMVVQRLEKPQVLGETVAASQPAITQTERAGISNGKGPRVDFSQVEKVANQGGEDPTNYGPWMIAKNKQAQYYKNKVQQKNGNYESKKKERISGDLKIKLGSHFNYLKEENLEEIKGDANQDKR